MLEINWTYLNDDGHGTEYDTDTRNYLNENQFQSGIIGLMTDCFWLRIRDMIPHVATVVSFGIIQHFSACLAIGRKIHGFVVYFLLYTIC